MMKSAEYRQWDDAIEAIRDREYPMLRDTTYLDHAGTTLYSKSLMERFATDMIANLYGNPHSASNASQLTTRRIEDVRLSLLRLFNADPEEFDVVFVANATAGIKLVADAFRDQENGFWYGYHRDAHTSLVGVRETAKKHRCFETDLDVMNWINHDELSNDQVGLFAYPAQSNMNGRRLPLGWAHSIRKRRDKAVFTLLDAASFATTSPLDLSDAQYAPDFTVLSLYKVFGFPDLGALIVRQASAGVFNERRYFGGGTVEMVVCLSEQWHAKKSGPLHERLEDGTLPIHSIIALGIAMAVHEELYQSFQQISRRTTYLATKLYEGLGELLHGNGRPVCQIYKDPTSTYRDSTSQGPIVAFNIQNQYGGWFSNSEVEKLASIKKIQLRTGGLCNPGGVASSLELAPWEMRENFSSGQRCDSEDDLLHSKPTGIIRTSLGPMSTLRDVNVFIAFMREFFVQDLVSTMTSLGGAARIEASSFSRMHVESLSVYPIKSCAGFSVPPGKKWRLRPEGLAWDREWCLVHQGTGSVLSQKRYPKMALICPNIDLEKGLLQADLVGTLRDTTDTNTITVPLSADPRVFMDETNYKTSSTRVCGESIIAKTYRSDKISSFFTQALGVPCSLARFPAAGSRSGASRYSKAHFTKPQNEGAMSTTGATSDIPSAAISACVARPILLSNESPILMISRSSLNRLNEQIKTEGGKAAQAEVFRANIVIAEDPSYQPELEHPYAEDFWQYLRIGQQFFGMLGACRRCQMVCIDQQSAEKNQEPFVTLSKTRRFNGRVYFGEHSCHIPLKDSTSPFALDPTIMVSDPVRPFRSEESDGDELLHSIIR